MKEKLIEILGLTPDASDEAVIAAVTSLETVNAVRLQTQAEQEEINKIVRESCGALNQDGAKLVLAHRRETTAKTKS